MSSIGGSSSWVAHPLFNLETHKYWSHGGLRCYVMIGAHVMNITCYDWRSLHTHVDSIDLCVHVSCGVPTVPTTYQRESTEILSGKYTTAEILACGWLHFTTFEARVREGHHLTQGHRLPRRNKIRSNFKWGQKCPKTFYYLPSKFDPLYCPTLLFWTHDPTSHKELYSIGCP